MSTADDNSEMLGEDEIRSGKTEAAGKKRATTERSSSEIPPVAKKRQVHRAVVWQHFTQKEDNRAISNCR